MESMGLPMSFGKKAKSGAVNLKSKVDDTKRDDVSCPCRCSAICPILCFPVSSYQRQPPPPPAQRDVPSSSSLNTERTHQSNSGLISSVQRPPNTDKEDEGDNEDEDDDIGPKPPSVVAGAKRKAEDGEDGPAGEEDGEESDEGFEEDEGDSEQLPISHEIILKDHSKVGHSFPIRFLQNKACQACSDWHYDHIRLLGQSLQVQWSWWKR